MARSRSRLALFLAVVPLGLALPSISRADQATLYRDEFGIPHVFAANLADAAYVVGYAQAEDRLEELLKNYRRANGTMAEVFGPDYFRDDLTQRLFQHAAVSRTNFHRLSPELRAVIESFHRGVVKFMKDHPEQAPAWAQPIEPADVVALGRYIIYGWPLGEASSDLERAGIKPEERPYRGSNQILLAPWRTASHVPMAIIDPHLSWYGEFRFYQLRIYAGEYNASGVCILGTPLPALGHSRFCSVAMTTGGPDTSDVFEEELNPANPRQYRYDGAWREMEVRREKIGVKKGGQIDWQIVENEYTHHGPIVARQNGKAYAMAIPYAREVGLMDQTYQMMQARNLAEMKAALGQLQLMGQNVMVGTVQGDIYYLRNGRVPIRPPGIDSHRPIPGNSSSNEWRGIHPLSDLAQITNPPQGYMHNNNVTPFAMMKESPLTPEAFEKFPYLYNASRTAPRHQRGEMMTELLDAAKRVTLDDALEIAFNTRVYHAELWQQRLAAAWKSASPAHVTREPAEVYRLIEGWDRRSERDSEGALAFYAFKKGLGTELAGKVDPPENVSKAQLLAAVTQAAEWLVKNFNSVHVPYGRYFRVGRQSGEKTWPVSGGSLTDAGMATTRAIGFTLRDQQMVGRSGQTSTQIVFLTDPPESYTVVPLGVSDHKESGHWDDQAEKLFSQSRASPAYFLRRTELMKHCTATNNFEAPSGR